MSGRLWRLAVCLVVWMAVLASAAPLDLVLGLVVAGALVLVPAPGDPIAHARVPVARRTLGVPRLVGAVVADVGRGTWDVALRVLHLREVEQPGLVEVPIGERTELGLAVSALVTTLSPGTVLVDIDRERGVMVVHVIDASDPDRVREQHARFYEDAQRAVVP